MAERLVAARAIFTAFFHGIFDGFRAGGDEDRLLGEIARHSLVEAFGQRHVVLVGHDLMAGMGKAIELVFYRRNHLRMAVAGVDDRDAGREIDIAAAFDIPEFGILGPFGIDLGGDADAARDRVGTAGRNVRIQHGSPLKMSVTDDLPVGAKSAPHAASKIFFAFFL
jgi:hypothetical protein